MTLTTGGRRRSQRRPLRRTERAFCPRCRTWIEPGQWVVGVAGAFGTRRHDLAGDCLERGRV